MADPSVPIYWEDNWSARLSVEHIDQPALDVPVLAADQLLHNDDGPFSSVEEEVAQYERHSFYLVLGWFKCIEKSTKLFKITIKSSHISSPT